MAGGVALNCVANGRLLREGPFTRLFVQPAAGDAGACLGAAALAQRALTGRPPIGRALEHVYLGPRFSCDAIAEQLAASSSTRSISADARPRCWKPRSIAWRPAASSPGSTAAWSSDRAPSALAASSPIRGCRTCAIA